MIIPLPLDAALGDRTDTTGGAGFILHERACAYHWEGHGPLSIKAFFSGRAVYEVEGGRHAVDDTAYLVLSHGQSYALTIDAPTPVESLCIFFEPRLVAEAQGRGTHSLAQLLDDPWPGEMGPPYFERTYRHDNLVSPALFTLRAALLRGEREPAALTEHAHALLDGLLAVQTKVWREIEALPAARASTRAEAYRRVYLAVDYIDAMYNHPLQLDDPARVASLSVNHLLRLFRQVVGQTPHQYMTDTRLRRARALLRETRLPVTEICFAVGFQSLGSFSTLFRRRVGLSPEAYRRGFR